MGYDIEVMADCASNYGVFHVVGSATRFSAEPQTYVVAFSGSEGQAHCTCPAFKYSGEERHCKHIDRAWNGACMYNPQWCDGHTPVKYKPVEYTYDAIIPGEECPNCGGPVVAVRRAV